MTITKKGYSLATIGAFVIAGLGTLGITTDVVPVPMFMLNELEADLAEHKVSAGAQDEALKLEIRAMRLADEVERMKRDERRDPESWTDDDQKRLEKTEHRLEILEDKIWDSIVP